LCRPGGEDGGGTLAGVALLGFGTVGSAVARRLTAGTHRLELTHIFDRRAALKHAACDRLTRVTDILNGTTNAVLSQMDATGCTRDEALADARARGWAEADPSADIDGADAAAKLSILCAPAFGLRVEPALIETRSAALVNQADFAAARRRSETIREIAHAEYDRQRSVLTNWVAPVRVPGGSLFARTTGAVAVISDVVAIARDRAAVVPAPVLKTPRTIVGLPGSDAKVETSNFRLPTSSMAEAV
jgi:homoserine dehydrogenase